jgi:hypothetical protein
MIWKYDHKEGAGNGLEGGEHGLFEDNTPV